MTTAGRLSLLAGLTVALTIPSPGQGHYYERTVQLPDTSWSTPIRRASISPTAMDVRSLGMGRTRIADVRSQSWVSYSPALLAGESVTRGIGSLYFNTPFQTIDAVSFISSNSPELDSAYSLRALRDAVEEYIEGGNAPADVVEKLETVAAYTRELIDKAIGDPSNPNVHEALLGFNAQMQLGHWGFSVTGYGQTGMTIRMGAALQELLEIYLTTDFTDTAQVDDAAERIRGLTDIIVDPLTGSLNQAALPAIFAVTYADLMATAGYGLTLFGGSVDVGANLKVLNRRFSVNRMSSEEAGDFTQNAFRGLEYGVTGITFDLGGYHRTASGLAFGVTLENIIPFTSLSRRYTAEYSEVWLANDLDSAGNPIVNADGDTALVAYTRQNHVEGPAELELQFVANAGAMIPVTPDWDISVEVVDIMNDQTKYIVYGERVGVGTEYRLRFFGGKFHVSPRIGFTQMNPSAGLGLSYAGIVRLDLAYFTSKYIESRRMVAGQLSICW